VTAGLAALALAASPALWLGPRPPRPVTRLVTVAPSLTETVLALGAGETLVGVSRFDEAPEVRALPRVGGFVDPSVEAILALAPQLVVVQKSPGNQRPIETLAARGVPVLALPLTSVADTADALVTLGELLGREAQARALVKALADARASQRSLAPKRPARVLFVYGFSPLVVAGPGSFAAELLDDCGAANVAHAATTAYPVWSLEQLLAAPPEVLVDAADTPKGRDALRALLPRTRWVTLADKDLLHPGPALARALPPLCAALRDRRATSP
jgi:iron complex transport system substrate-binding protein